MQNVCGVKSPLSTVMDDRSSMDNLKQWIIQKSGNTEYPCCIQPRKSLNYYLLVMLLVTE
jgi:hypothetical protein